MEYDANKYDNTVLFRGIFHNEVSKYSKNCSNPTHIVFNPKKAS